MWLGVVDALPTLSQIKTQDPGRPLFHRCLAVSIQGLGTERRPRRCDAETAVPEQTLKACDVMLVLGVVMVGPVGQPGSGDRLETLTEQDAENHCHSHTGTACRTDVSPVDFSWYRPYLLLLFLHQLPIGALGFLGCGGVVADLALKMRCCCFLRGHQLRERFPEGAQRSAESDLGHRPRGLVGLGRLLRQILCLKYQGIIAFVHRGFPGHAAPGQENDLVCTLNCLEVMSAQNDGASGEQRPTQHLQELLGHM